MVRAGLPRHKSDNGEERVVPGGPSVVGRLAGALRSPLSSPDIQDYQATVSPVALYIDPQQFSRDCVSQHIATRWSDCTVHSVASIHHLSHHTTPPIPFLIIFNLHGVSLGDTATANEMSGIREFAPGVPLVIMSDLDEAAEVYRAMEQGARGYVPAQLPLPRALAAMRLVADGGIYIPECVLAAPILERPTDVPLVDSEGHAINLSPRQRQVLEHLKQGKQNKIIAYELKMCESTVKVHIRHIMQKLKARNRTQIVLLTQNTRNGSASTLAA